MLITHLRFQTTKKHTKSVLCIDGVFQCFILEDTFRVKKKYGETRITPATRKIELRTEGKMNKKYLAKYGKWHKGMLWIKDVNNYKYVYLHVGNKPKDTLGCLLTGFSADTNKNSIEQSRLAYEKIYPIISNAILKGEEVLIETIDFEQIT